MSQANKNQKTENQPAGASANDSTVEVLYQKLGDKWYAFSIIGDDVFVGAIPSDELSKLSEGEGGQDAGR